MRSSASHGMFFHLFWFRGILPKYLRIYTSRTTVACFFGGYADIVESTLGQA